MRKLSSSNLKHPQAFLSIFKLPQVTSSILDYIQDSSINHNQPKAFFRIFKHPHNTSSHKNPCQYSLTILKKSIVNNNGQKSTVTNGHNHHIPNSFLIWHQSNACQKYQRYVNMGQLHQYCSWKLYFYVLYILCIYNFHSYRILFLSISHLDFIPPTLDLFLLTDVPTVAHGRVRRCKFTRVLWCIC